MFYKPNAPSSKPTPGAHDKHIPPLPLNQAIGHREQAVNAGNAPVTLPPIQTNVVEKKSIKTNSATSSKKGELLIANPSLSFPPK